MPFNAARVKLSRDGDIEIASATEVEAVAGFPTRINLSDNSSIKHYLLALGLVLLVSACGGGGGDSDGSGVTPVALPAARGLEPAIALSDATFNEAHFAGSEACNACHNDENVGDAAVMVDSTGRDVAIGDAWASSLMANSARDPYWHAVAARELAEFPSAAQEINDTCTRCHAPMANDLARKEGFELQIFDSGSVEEGTFVQGFLSKDATDSTFNHAMDGVSCTLCHQIADTGNLGSFESQTGGYEILLSPVRDERPAYAQYVDPDVGYMKTQVEFTPAFGAHMSTSETCATCHNLNTTPLDENGEPVPGISHFAEQAMYTEWQFSDFRTGGPQEQQCQDCHMPTVDQDIPIAIAGTAPNRPNFAEHSFLAANTVMQQMMDDYRTQLGIPADVDFQASIARNRAFLAESADVTITNTAVDGQTLLVDVQVINNAGHKLPSGYHARRAYLHVLVTDNNGSIVYENGKLNADGSIDGVAEDTNPFTFEPHYNIITDATQVQVYEATTSDVNGDVTHSLLAATGYLKDNRLTPVGFDKNAVPDDIAVAGLATGDDNFNLGSDLLQYQIPVSDPDATYNVVVELMYQPFGFGHLQELFSLSSSIDQVDQFRTIYENTTLRAETLDVDFVTVN